jgi:hypothetical protein
MPTNFNAAVNFISLAGTTRDMQGTAIRKRIVFNRLNFFAMAASTAWLLALLVFFDYKNNITVLLFSAGPLMCSAIIEALMFAEKDRAALTFSFFIYPPVLLLTAVYSQHSLVLYYLPVFSLLTFFFLNNIQQISLLFLYNLLFFGIGIYITGHKDSTSAIMDLYLVATVFAVIYIIAYKKTQRLKNKRKYQSSRPSACRKKQQPCRK